MHAFFYKKPVYEKLKTVLPKTFRNVWSYIRTKKLALKRPLSLNFVAKFKTIHSKKDEEIFVVRNFREQLIS